MSTPSDKKYLAHYRVLVDFGLCLTDKRNAMRRLNVHYTGGEEMGFGATIADVHRDSHYSVHAIHQITMDVGLRPDGVLEPVAITDDDNERGMWWCTWKEFDDRDPQAKP